MKLMVCSVFDVKANAFMSPFFVPNVNIARRSFGDAVLDPSTGISKHPEDYRLYQVSIFDDNSGLFNGSFSKPEFLANATDFLNVKKEVSNEADSGE
jgi:hypothetical protein